MTNAADTIVAYLRENGERSGHEIANALKLGSGVLYPALHDLEVLRGVLTSRWGEPLCNGPRPRLYTLAEPRP